MSEIINEAVKALQERLGDDGFDGSVKMIFEDEGALIIDGDGVRASDGDADCTLRADAETFRGMLEGEVNATSAFMTGKLTIDGNMGDAMKLGALLS